MGEDKDDKKDEKRDKKDKKKLLEEIRATVSELAREQRALRAEVSRLSTRIASERGEGPLEEILEFLDGFRSQEALGELAFGAWLSVCEDDRLRGGLRTIQMREGSHARLLEERIKMLGGSLQREVPEQVQRETLEQLGDVDRGDAAKLREFVARFPEIDAALAPICEMAERIGPDYETRALLETIAADERATLEFLHAECARLASAG